jgi:autotransporter-associated beta strand protein
MRRGIGSRRTAVLAAAVSGLAITALPAMADLNWDGNGGHATGGGSGTWNAANNNWWNGSADQAWNSTGAVFGNTTTASTVTMSGTLNTTGLTFSTTGYTVTSSTGTNTLTLTGATPGISVNTGANAILGTNPASATAPIAWQLQGSNGFTLSGGGELILAGQLGVTGGIAVNGGSTLTVGNRNLTASLDPTLLLNNNAVTLTSSNLTFATSATRTGTPPGNGWASSITVNGTSNLNLQRTASSASTSFNMQNTAVVLNAGAQLNVNPTGNTTGLTPFVQFASVTQNGNATIQATDNGTNGENVRLGNFIDNGFNTTFLSGGTATLQGTQIRTTTYSTGSSTQGGTWTLGSSTGGGTAGVQLEVDTASGSTGQMTNNTITVNASSQLEFFGSGQLTWGVAGQTINLNGDGITNGTNGAMFFFSNTLSGTGVSNELLSNVVLQSNSTIAVTTGTTSQIDGNITGNFKLTKGAAGTLNINGTANNWTGGTTITSGTIEVAAASSISTSNLSLASNSVASTPALILHNPTQTVSNLSSSFIVTTGTASNTLTLDGTALTIKQSSNTTWGPGAVPTLSSTIQDGGSAGSIVLDATSAGTLTLSGPNTYSGGTTINGGTLIAANTSGSATGSGAVVVAGGSLGGSGSISGAVTLTSGAILPGTAVGGNHIGGTLSTGSLTLNGGSLTFNLNTPASSDLVSATALAVGGPVTINLNNLGALGAATYHLINYSSGSLSTPAFNNLTLGTQPAGFTFMLQNDPNAVDLVVTAAAANVWTAQTNTIWDTSTQNWNSGSGLFTNGDSVLFDDTANGTSPLSVSIPADVSPGLVTFNNNSKNYTVGGAGKIAGNTNLVLTGTGTVTLTSQNSFAGTVAVSAGGTLSVSADNQLGNASNPVSLTSSSSTQLSTLQVASTYTSARAVTLYGVGGAIDVTGSNTLTLTSGLAGGGGLTKSNTGTLVLTAPASFAGNTNVTGGTLKLGANGVLPSGTALTISSGATVDTQTFNNSAGSLAGAGNLSIGTGATFTAGFNNADTTFSGVISGAGTLNKVGAGTLTLTGTTNNITGGVSIAGGGKIIAAQGSLGTATAAPTISISAASTLQLSTAYTYTQQVISPGAGNGTLNLNSNAASLSFLGGTGVLTVVNGPSLKLNNRPSSTAAANTGGIVVGNGSDTVVLDVAGADTGSGIPAIGTGTVTINTGSTFWLDGIKDGFNGTAPTGTGNSTVTFKSNTTWKATGSAAYSGGSPTIDTGATVTINVPTSTDSLIENTTFRNPATGGQDTSNAINVTGNGTLQLSSGAVSNTTATQFFGSWTIGTGSTAPKVIASPITGTFGEVLNAFGYAQGANTGPGAPVTLQGGTLAFGVDSINPAASSPLSGVNSFRSPLTLSGGTIGSTGQEINVPSSTTTAGVVFNNAANALVSANLAGNITLSGGATVTADTFDPIGATAATVGRNLNFTTDGTGVSGNFTWGSGSTLSIAAGSSTGGAINFGRTGGTVSISTPASITIAAGATVNVGKWFTPGSYTGATFNPGSLKNVPSAIDPFTDSADNTKSLDATVAGSLVYANNQATGAGTVTMRLNSLTVQGGGSVKLENPVSGAVADRTILSTGSLLDSGNINLGKNEILITNDPSKDKEAMFGLVSSMKISSTDVSGSLAVGYVGNGDFAANSPAEARLTLLGDSDLNGNVNVADLANLAGNFGQTSGKHWLDGDFDYNHTVNVADLADLAGNFGADLGGGSSAGGGAAAPAAALASGGGAAVPEPTAVAGLLAFGGTALLARRRRKL